MIKIDLAKAFDRLEWGFIEMALQKQGFNNHFIKLIKACMTNTNFSVIINGNHHGKFQSQRGIRQGCPLSPYLFVIAINELSVQLQEELQKTNIQGIRLGPNCPPIYSLMLANDLLVCG
ncbi:reverse transcriptase domain-containing protein, partial [Legionella pneumophila]|uniref:reverse transcriptase domain-containing protein n=1 Tax=Legionella pneumophila TaxID=446 RepID=UPI0020BFD7BE